MRKHTTAGLAPVMAANCATFSSLVSAILQYLRARLVSESTVEKVFETSKLEPMSSTLGAEVRGLL